MKKLIVSTIALALVLHVSNAKAEDNKTEERVGFGSGLLIGAIAGGPAGAIIGAVSGAWLGDKVNESDKVPELETSLAATKVDLNRLRDRLKVADNQLHEARIQLQNQHVTQQKVANQMNVVSGLKLDIMFRTNSSELESTIIDKLVPVAMMLEEFPDFDVQLTGHGDTLGTVEANRIVAEDRALRVKQSLVNAGIDGRRIHIVNLGKAEAEADFEDIEGRALERRVRIQFVEATGSTKPTLAQN